MIQQVVAVGPDGRIYVVDCESDLIRVILQSGEVITIGGMSGVLGSLDGEGPAARFNFPQGIAVDGSEKLYVPDGDNNVISAGTLSYLL
jgi:DNA-binding beta-propeller fold protein YncE